MSCMRTNTSAIRSGAHTFVRSWGGGGRPCQLHAQAASCMPCVATACLRMVPAVSSRGVVGSPLTAPLLTCGWSPCPPLMPWFGLGLVQAGPQIVQCLANVRGPCPPFPAPPPHPHPHPYPHPYPHQYPGLRGLQAWIPTVLATSANALGLGWVCPPPGLHCSRLNICAGGSGMRAGLVIVASL